MRKTMPAFLFVFLALAVFQANAQFEGAQPVTMTNQGAGGFTGPGITATSVAEARRLRHEAPVVLRGRIERALGDEKYLFTDGTASITIEIDDKLWGGLSVNEADLVEISGEMDRDARGRYVDVRSIRKI